MAVAATERWVDAEIPAKLMFFQEWGKWRYKIAYGGRGAAKSRSISTILSAEGTRRPLRWLCARETQKSLELSSQQIIWDAMARLQIQNKYVKVEKEIRGLTKFMVPDESTGVMVPRHTIFRFDGIREMSVDAIKSIEEFDGIWVAEGHNLTETSWNKIVPTFRKKGSEIWVDFNPEFAEDFIYKLAQDPPRNAKVVHVNYYDNPWFKDTELVGDMEEAKEKYPDTYDHIWLGVPKNSVVGAVYGKEIEDATNEGRIVLTPGIGIDRTKPVDTFWDLGHGDATAIWFAQSVNGWFNIVDYEEGNGKSIEHWAAVIQAKKYPVGIAWLPWDGVSGRTHNKMTGSVLRSPEQVLRSLGVNVRVASDSGVDQGISATRSIFPQLRFNEPKCHEGIRRLRRYQWGKREPNKSGTTLVQAKPLHDENSHPADALRTLAICIKQPRRQVEEKDPLEDRYNVYTDSGGSPIGNGGYRS